MDYVIRHQNTGLDYRLDWLKMTWTETAVQSIFQSSPVQSRLNLQSNRLDLKTLFLPLHLHPSFVAAFRSPSGFPPCPHLLLNIDDLWLHLLNSRLSHPSTSPCHTFLHATRIALCHLPLPSHFYPFRFASSRVSHSQFIFSLLHPSESLSFAHVSASS